MSRAKKVKLGDKYRDTISGFEGVATARYEFVNGCVRYELERRMRPDEKEPVVSVFDEQRLQAIDEKPIARTARAGGPRSAKPVSRR